MSRIDTEHPEYINFALRWTIMTDAFSDEDAVKLKNTEYLPKTGGMIANDHDGKRYDAYKLRARFPEITTQAQTSMVGLIFENDPVGESDDIISNTGQANKAFARDVVRAVAGKGRDILVIDAPTKEMGGGDPFIARYSAESLINWKTVEGKPAEFTLAVFRETRPSDPDDIYGHETEVVFRRYLRVGAGVEVSLWQIVEEDEVLIGEPVMLPVKFMPIIAVGSIDSLPNCDPIPLLPVARGALSYYRKSADYEQSLHLHGQPTPWVSGITEEQYNLILLQGVGSGSLWHLGESGEGKAGFLSIDSALGEHRVAMEDDLKQAESFAVRVTQQSDTPESGVAIAKRAAAQHASIYTIADSVSIAVTAAQRMRAAWAGQPEPEDFVLNAEIEEDYAGEQMITSLNNAINSGNAPQSAMFEAIRKTGLSEKSDDEMRSEIETTGGLTFGGDDDNEAEPVAVDAPS